MKRKVYLAILAALSMIAIGGAYAAQSSENDALPISTAKIGLTQAVVAAERHAGGPAARAEYEREKGKWVFDVEVVKDVKVMNVKVDPMSGQVISTDEDRSDHDDDRDHTD
jgi:uncharacterized membrane protein YkoI